MIVASTLILEKKDLLETSKSKKIEELWPSDFKPNIVNLINACSIVILKDKILKNKFGKKGDIV